MLPASKKVIAALCVVAFAAALVLVVSWLGRRLGWGVFGSAPFLWGMSGFVLIGGFFALLIGTFATDAPTSTAANFWIAFAATFLLIASFGLPFACLVSWPATLWLRPLLAPLVLVGLVSLISPLGGIAGLFVAKR